MSIYRNVKEEFGFSGPFEAESRESLADEMDPSFQVWADDAEARWNEDCDPGEEFPRAEWLDDCRARFIQGLEEIPA